MRFNRLLCLITFGFCASVSFAQNYFATNLYAYDLFMVNPAAAAIKSDCYAINGYYQKQWFGTDLSPTTQMLAFQKAFQSNLGMGTYVYNDRNGFYKQMGLQQSLAYSLTLSKNRRYETNLQFGMSLLVDQRSLDVSELGADGSFDPVINGDAQNSGFGLNANAGLMLTLNAWQFGVSFTNILPYSNSLYSKENEPDVPMDMNFTVGTSFKVADRNLYLEPLVYYRRNSYLDSRTDVNLKFLMPSVDPSFAWWGLLAYRRTMDHNWGNNLGAATTLGIIKNGFKVGLEYQLGLTSAQRYFGSAYQLVVGYRFCYDRSNDAIKCSKRAEGVNIAPK